MALNWNVIVLKILLDIYNDTSNTTFFLVKFGIPMTYDSLPLLIGPSYSIIKKFQCM